MMLNAAFFCVTNGSDFDFYVAGDCQGRRIRLSRPLPSPSPEYFRKGPRELNEGNKRHFANAKGVSIDNVSKGFAGAVFPKELDNLIDSFLLAHKKDKKLFNDTKWHDV